MIDIHLQIQFRVDLLPGCGVMDFDLFYDTNIKAVYKTTS